MLKSLVFGTIKFVTMVYVADRTLTVMRNLQNRKNNTDAENTSKS